MDLHNRIDELCREKGISGYALCRAVGMQPSVLTDLKMGRQKGLSVKNTAKIAAYFGLTVEEFLGEETAAEKEKAPTLASEDLETLDKLNRLSEADRRYIEGMIDAYLSRR